MADPKPSHVAKHVRVAIAGSGSGGLGTAIRLTQSGIDGFLVFERTPEDRGAAHRGAERLRVEPFDPSEYVVMPRSSRTSEGRVTPDAAPRVLVNGSARLEAARG